ncbi:MAG: hypothetical protein DCF16_18660 [Alphaproteobacteria bacterium]|nr:MAG: hypothetical protein DCF16_18660 [Alphaproteobacteria bacterium]
MVIHVAEPQEGQSGEQAHAGGHRAQPADSSRSELNTLYTFTDRLLRAVSEQEVYDAALDAIIEGLNCTRASILLFDGAGVMRFVASHGLSPAYRAAVDGHTPWTLGQRDAVPITEDNIAHAEIDEALRSTISGEGIRALAFIPLVANGGVIGKFMAYDDAPHVFTKPEIDLGLVIARQLGFAIERQQARVYRKESEEARRRNDAEFRAIVENSDDAIISKNLDGVIVSWNQGAEHLFGYAPQEIIGRSVLTLIPPELQHEEPSIISRIRRGERIEHYDTVRLKKDGTRIDISLTVSPVKDAEGRIIGASKIARDISERIRAEGQRTLLINELNHRVKNTLATVQSLVMQTLRNTERSEEARELLDSRLAALSRAHDLLTAENWEGASLGEVVDRALSPFRTDAQRIRAEGPSVRLSPKQALALSIALHELATNASKYGALSGDAGHIEVRWSLADGMIHCGWCEKGGPPVEQPHHSGFGTRLIQRNLATELGGSALIEYRPEGVVATITAPVEPAAHKLI